MNQNKKRDSYVRYRSFFEAVKDLPPTIRAQVNLQIDYYVFEGKEIDLEPMAKSLWTLIKPQIDANNQKFENGCKGGRPKTKQKPKHNQSITETEPNDNVNDNVNVSYEENNLKSFEELETGSLSGKSILSMLKKIEDDHGLSSQTNSFALSILKQYKYTNLTKKQLDAIRIKCEQYKKGTLK